MREDRSNWTRIRFGDVVESVTDRVDDPSTAGVDRYVGLEHLDTGSLTINRWGSPTDVEATKLRFKPGDVVFARRRAYQRKLGQADFEGIASAHSLVLRARPDRVLSEFLPVFVSSDAFMDRAIQISVGSLSPTVNWKTLAVQEFDLPPVEEQRRIADLMWALERNRCAAYRRTTAVARMVVAAADDCLRSFSPSRLSGVADVVTGPPYPSSDYCSASDGTRLLRGANIGVGHTRWEHSDTVHWPERSEVREEFVLRAGDLVVAMDRPFTADGRLRAAVIGSEDGGCLLNQRVTRVRAKEGIDAGLVSALRASSAFGRALSGLQTGSFAPHISVRDVANFEFGSVGSNQPNLDYLLETELAHARSLDALDKSSALAGALTRRLLGARS